MIPIIVNARCVLMHGDSAELGLVLGPNTVDSIVTDPPAGFGFMGKGWDSDKGGRDQWIAWLRELLRPAFAALKPGGYALVWAIPRTSHWTATALEDAGFEIRDVHHHIFGTGFPKSKDIARAIDMHLCSTPGRHFDKNLARGAKAKPGDHICPEHPRRAIANGMGTALKPAVEHWILARKPIEGTNAENALKYGTGGLAIDACRIGESGGTASSATEPNYKNEVYGAGMGGIRPDPDIVLGRWPAHLSLDEFAAMLLDEQSGETGCGSSSEPAERTRDTTGPGFAMTQGQLRDDRGGASRFFYVAKGSRAEKDEGLDHLPASSGGEATGREEGSLGTQNPRAGAGRTGGARNIHPTVKSIALMEWLVKLVTPPGGLVLDVFAGSGTTGVAALRQGYEFLGVEKGGDSGEYIPIIRGRLEHELRTLGLLEPSAA